MSASTTTDSANVLLTSGMLDATRAYTDLHLPGGRVVRLPTVWLKEDSAQALASSEAPSEASATDTPAIPLSSSAVTEEAPFAFASPADLLLVQNGAEPITIPLVVEQLEIGKRVVPTGKVLLHKSVQTYETQLDERLAVRTFDIERVMLNQPVEAAPAVRQEGDTTVYPVVEEQLVLTKQLILREELRITRRDTERRDTQTVSLRRENITVERQPLVR